MDDEYCYLDVSFAQFGKTLMHWEMRSDEPLFVRIRDLVLDEMRKKMAELATVGTMTDD